MMMSMRRLVGASVVLAAAVFAAAAGTAGAGNPHESATIAVLTPSPAYAGTVEVLATTDAPTSFTEVACSQDSTLIYAASTLTVSGVSVFFVLDSYAWQQSATKPAGCTATVYTRDPRNNRRRDLASVSFTAEG